MNLEFAPYWSSITYSLRDDRGQAGLQTTDTQTAETTEPQAVAW